MEDLLIYTYYSNKSQEVTMRIVVLNVSCVVAIFESRDMFC